MTDETSRDLRLEIAHVLFIDIIGYSKLLHNQQSEVFRELNEVVRGTEQFLSADSAGTLLRLPTGDGMALIFARVRKLRQSARWKLPRRLNAIRSFRFEWEFTAAR